MALADVVDLLICPHCRRPVTLTGRVLGCEQGHRFDLARQGHVNLLGHAAPQHADTAQMVAARADFLSAGHFRPLAELMARAAHSSRVLDVHGSRVLEVGAGTGYYLQHCLRSLGEAARGVASDLSAYACRRAARLPRVGAVVADTWAGLPVADGCIDTVLCAFAPRNAAEFSRVVAAEGTLVVLTPTERHLGELRRDHDLLQVHTGKVEQLERSLAPRFALRHSEVVEYELELSPADQRNLVLMGPNAFHQQHFQAPTARTVTVSVRLGCYR